MINLNHEKTRFSRDTRPKLYQFLKSTSSKPTVTIKRLLVFILSVFLVSTGTSPVRAITVVARDFDQLVTRADTVFKGTVANKHSEWTGEGNARHIVTFVTFQVEETYKGTVAAEQTLRFLGGTVDDTTLEVPEMPQFEVGQKAILFVVGNGKQFCPLVGVTQGRFHVIRDATTGTERIFTDDHFPVVATAKIGRLDATGTPLLQSYAHADAQAMKAGDFRAEILGKVIGLTR